MDSYTASPTSKKRLIVLVPEGVAGNPDLAKKIYWMAHHNQCDVLYLAFIDQVDERFAVSRRLATMKALTSDESLAVTTKYTLTNQWLHTLKSIYMPGDMIVCHEEQFVRTGFLQSSSLQDWLSNLFRAPIHTISGFYHPWQVLSHKLLLGLAFWLGCLVILAGFSLVEFQIDQFVQGLTHSILLIIVFVLEFGSIWAWNRLPRL